MVSRKTVATLLLVHVVAMLASQTEAFVPIFTYSELQRMQERERHRGHAKSLSVQQRAEPAAAWVPAEPALEEESRRSQLTAPVEIGWRMNSRQLEKYRDALEGLLSELPPPLLSAQHGAQ
ncbi:promotilin [Ochotona curzoniae]|uniref:promotilin n=1 Tax=Ochotona curzoniae TaxID=130825 RepID=UPI001B34FD91|nr:promotilin [Ochotona curzoniae]